MKKILITLFVILISGISFIWTLNIVNADSGITVTVTEKIPGAGCKPEKPEPWYNWTYECTIEPWFGTVTKMMGSMVKYATFLAGLIWVLFIVYNGIMYSMGWIEQSLKDNAKKRIVQTLIWLVVLLLSWVILNLVAPWIYTK